MSCAVLLFIVFVHVSADYLQNACDAGKVLPLQKEIPHYTAVYQARYHNETKSTRLVLPALPVITVLAVMWSSKVLILKCYCNSTLVVHL